MVGTKQCIVLATIERIVRGWPLGRAENKMRFADHPKKDEIVKKIVEWAGGHPEVSRVIVYGSRARGEHRPDSDIDIAVEVQPSSAGDIPPLVWLDNKGKWSAELDPMLPWRLHLEWHDPQGSTPTVSKKIANGNYVVFSGKKYIRQGV